MRSHQKQCDMLISSDILLLTRWDIDVQCKTVSVPTLRGSTRKWRRIHECAGAGIVLWTVWNTKLACDRSVSIDKDQKIQREMNDRQGLVRWSK